MSALPGHGEYPADVKGLLTSGMARACWYAGSPDCQVLAAVCYGWLPALCATCDQRRSTLGKGVTPGGCLTRMRSFRSRPPATPPADRDAVFPVVKTLEDPDRSICSIPGPTLEYVASLEWITARENLCLVGSARHR